MKVYSAWLPFPPSINSAFGGGSGQRRFKSKKYKEWEKKAIQMLPAIDTINLPVRIEYTFFMPDKRPRDVGNYEKCCTDLLVNKRILHDDNVHCVKEINLKFGGYDKTIPRVEMEIFV